MAGIRIDLTSGGQTYKEDAVAASICGLKIVKAKQRGLEARGLRIRVAAVAAEQPGPALSCSGRGRSEHRHGLLVRASGERVHRDRTPIHGYATDLGRESVH